MTIVTVDSRDMKRAIATVKPIIPAKTTIPAIMSARITVANGEMTIEATDLSRAIWMTIPATGSGAWLLDFGKLSAIASALPDGKEVTLSGDGTAAIKCGRISAKIMSLAPDDFPSFTCNFKGGEFAMPAKVLKDILSRADKCRRRDNTNTSMGGIHMTAGGGKIRVESTDGKMLSRITVKAEIATSIDTLLPGDIAQSIATLPDGDMTVMISPSMASFASGSVTLITKLIDAQYPEIDHVLPPQIAAKCEASAFDTASLLAAIKACSASQAWDSDAVALSVTSDGAFITGSGNEGETISVPVECEPGAAFELKINPLYATAMIGAAARETIRLSSSGLALLAVDDGDDFTGVVMARR